MTEHCNAILPTIFAFGISVLVCPILIPLLKKLKVGQFVRQDGPKTHIKKGGTPTMGGLVILLGMIGTSIWYWESHFEIAMVLLVTAGFGFVGLIDDSLKILTKQSTGLKAWQKFLGQLVVAFVFAYYMTRFEMQPLLLIPFSHGKYLDLGMWYVPVLLFIVLGTVNGVNFTDGLDGLASSVTILVATFFSVISVVMHSDLLPVSCAAVGALLGFLVFNIYPAKVFMGDTGSLALGGYVAAIAYVLHVPLFIPIVGFVYFAEVISVIMQVLIYHFTKKRLFKMAPLHHHFELSGWPETKVVAIFSIITAVLCLIGLLGMD